MKTLHNYISEKLVINKGYKYNNKYFIYKIVSRSKWDKQQIIKIFDYRWDYNKIYKTKIYINGEHVEVDKWGCTQKEYEAGEYEIYIEDFDKVTNCDFMFAECKQLIYVPYFDTSNVGSMAYMFKECINLEEVSLFDTSKVEDMEHMFEGCNNLTGVPSFDTSKVLNMYNMFRNCTNIETVPLFDTKKVKRMWGMFSGCTNLKEVPLFHTNMYMDYSNMFYKCKNLSVETKQRWSKVYDFNKNDKK